MIHPVRAVPGARGGARAEPGDGLRLRERLRAAGVHLALSAAAGAAVVALVFLAWYPVPMPALLGVEAILLIMLGVDVVLGPLFTLLVFDRRKPRLKWDLATIAAVQLAALAYGVFTVHQGRPAFVVFVKDRFEVVSPADLQPEARSAARRNPHAGIDPMRPRWVAADLLNDRVLPFFEEQGLPVLRMLTDRGSEYCGNLEHHAYQLYLAVEDIDHSRTKAYHPQTNGICERFHKTTKQEFYDIAFRKKLYRTLDELQADLDEWLQDYNTRRPHSGRYCYGKTPMQTFLDSKHLAIEKPTRPTRQVPGALSGQPHDAAQRDRSHAHWHPIPWACA